MESDEEDDQEERGKILKKICFPDVEKDTPSSHCQKVTVCIGKRLKKLKDLIKDLTNAADADNADLSQQIQQLHDTLSKTDGAIMNIYSQGVVNTFAKGNLVPYEFVRVGTLQVQREKERQREGERER